MELQIGQRCIKVGGDYQHTGTIVAVFQKTDGKTRVVVEFDAPVQGMLHILKPEQLELRAETRIESLRTQFSDCVLLFTQGHKLAAYGDDVWKVACPGSEIRYHSEHGYVTFIESQDLIRLRLAGIKFKVMGGEEQ